MTWHVGSVDADRTQGDFTLTLGAIAFRSSRRVSRRSLRRIRVFRRHGGARSPSDLVATRAAVFWVAFPAPGYLWVRETPAAIVPPDDRQRERYHQPRDQPGRWSGNLVENAGRGSGPGGKMLNPAVRHCPAVRRRSCPLRDHLSWTVFSAAQCVAIAALSPARHRRKATSASPRRFAGARGRRGHSRSRR